MTPRRILISVGILAAVAELFPEMGLSYFLPRSGDLKFYDQMVFYRVINALTVWSVIAWALYQMQMHPTSSGPVGNLAPLGPFLRSDAFARTSMAVFMVMCAFYFRMYAKDHLTQTQTGYKYAAGLVLILSILQQNCLSFECRLQSAIIVAMILIGGQLMSIGRQSELYIDLIGRIIFSVGILSFTNQLATLI